MKNILINLAILLISFQVYSQGEYTHVNSDFKKVPRLTNSGRYNPGGNHFYIVGENSSGSDIRIDVFDVNSPNYIPIHSISIPKPTVSNGVSINGTYVTLSSHITDYNFDEFYGKLWVAGYSVSQSSNNSNYQTLWGVQVDLNTGLYENYFFGPESNCLGSDLNITGSSLAFSSTDVYITMSLDISAIYNPSNPNYWCNSSSNELSGFIVFKCPRDLAGDPSEAYLQGTLPNQVFLQPVSQANAQSIDKSIVLTSRVIGSDLFVIGMYSRPWYPGASIGRYRPMITKISTSSNFQSPAAPNGYTSYYYDNMTGLDILTPTIGINPHTNDIYFNYHGTYAGLEELIVDNSLSISNSYEILPTGTYGEIMPVSITFNPNNNYSVIRGGNLWLGLNNNKYSVINDVDIMQYDIATPYNNDNMFSAYEINPGDYMVNKSNVASELTQHFNNSCGFDLVERRVDQNINITRVPITYQGGSLYTGTPEHFYDQALIPFTLINADIYDCNNNIYASYKDNLTSTGSSTKAFESELFINSQKEIAGLSNGEVIESVRYFNLVGQDISSTSIENYNGIYLVSIRTNKRQVTLKTFN